MLCPAAPNHKISKRVGFSIRLCKVPHLIGVSYTEYVARTGHEAPGLHPGG
jgi:hypothetical protein